MIRADRVQYEIGDFALNVSLEVGHGEYFVLLGASGAGKTLFLESLAGLRRLRAGSIQVGEEDVTAAPPGARRIGYVPQDWVLFHHLDVRGNIAFGLKVRRVSRPKREKEVRRLAEMLGLGALLDRRILGLSGGEQQRVALARALAARPSTLLLDEPVSALDEPTRDTVCRELVKLQRKADVSVLHVCHSFEEARLVADRIGVLCRGRVVQVGTADELMQRPADTYVARLLRLANVFQGDAVPADGSSRVEGDGFTLCGPPAKGKIEFLVRPWDIGLAAGDVGEGVNLVEGRIVEFSLAGPSARLRIDGPLPLEAVLPRQWVDETSLAVGRKIRLCFPREAVHIFAEPSDPRPHDGPK